MCICVFAFSKSIQNMFIRLTDNVIGGLAGGIAGLFLLCKMPEKEKQDWKILWHFFILQLQKRQVNLF